jgi:hypothetical protein
MLHNFQRTSTLLCSMFSYVLYTKRRKIVLWIPPNYALTKTSIKMRTASPKTRLKYYHCIYVQIQWWIYGKMDCKTKHVAWELFHLINDIKNDSWLIKVIFLLWYFYECAIEGDLINLKQHNKGYGNRLAFYCVPTRTI